MISVTSQSYSTYCRGQASEILSEPGMILFISQYTDKRIRARNSRNTSNAPSWYMLRLITSSAGSISHFIWTLKTQPLFLSLASPTSPWSAFEWGSQWYVFSSRYCTSYGVYQIEGNSFRTYDARDKTFFESEGSWTSKRYFGSKLCKLFGLWLLTTRHV